MTPLSVALGTLLLTFTVSGLFFNIYILFFCTKTNNQTRTASQILLLHLGFLNLILAVFFIVIYVPHLFSNAWLEDTTCSFIGPLWDCLHIVAVWTVASLNADKYITIASPLHYARFVSPSRAGIALLVTWLFATLIVVSIVFFHGLSYKMRSSVCVLDTFHSSDVAGEIHAGVANSLSFILPIFLVALTNGRILIIASHHRHRIVSALWDVTLSAQATVTQQKSHFYLTNYKGRSAATTIFHHVGSLLIMYLPTAACRIYEAITRLKVSSHLSTSAFILLAVSPTINGFVYGVRNKILRKLFMQVLRKQIYKSEVSCEIQARTPSASCSRRSSITPSITLPLQKQLTRRMSEIFTPATTPPSASSQNSCDAKFKLERQSSDISSSRGRSSEGSTPKDSTPPPFRTPETSPMTKFFPKVMHFQRGLDLNTPPGETSTAPPFFTGTHGTLNCSFSFNRQASLEIMPNGSGYNGGHRQSLRRALFARNKQKSLDLDMVHVKAETQGLSNFPPRSASHHEMQEQPSSPSAIQPLLLHSEPLTPSRRSKKVSWSSDSFSNPQEYPSHSETDISRKFKRKAISKENEFSSKQILERINFTSRENNDMRRKKGVSNEKYLTKTSPDEDTKEINVDSSSPNINVFDNPLSHNIPQSKLPKLYSPSEASIIAKIHICH